MPAFDAIDWANSARREIDATGAARANAGRGVHSIEGGVNRISGKPPVPASRSRAAAPAAPRPFGKPGQKIKGFGNAEGLNRIKGLVPPDPGHIGKYLSTEQNKGPLGF